MNAKDLFTALNDIDPKLLEDIDPWGAPAKKVYRHPWMAAVAAVLAVCVGVGSWLFLTQLRTSAPELEDTLSQTIHLDFAENTTGILGETTGYSSQEPGYRYLTQEELSQLRSQAGLSWLNDYYIGAAVYFDEQENVDYLLLTGFEKDKIDETGKDPFLGAPAFELSLREGELPPHASVETFFLEDPNNEVNGTEIWAVVRKTGKQLFCTNPLSYEVYPAQSLYSVVFLSETDSSVGVELNVYADGETMTDQSAKELAESASGEMLRQGIDLQWLTYEAAGDTSSSLPQDIILLAPETQTDRSSLSFSENNTGSEKSTSWVLGNEGDTERALTEEELSSLAKQDGLSWMASYHLSGTAYISPKGEVSWMMIRGSLGEEDQGMDAFVLYLQPGQLPRCEAQDVCSFLESANNQANGTDVWAAVTHSGRGYVDPETQESFSDDTTTYWTMFQQEGTDSTGVALGVSSDQWGFEDQEARELAEQATFQLVEHPVVLPLLDQKGTLSAQSDSSVSETGKLHLQFDSLIGSDDDLQFLNSFTDDYLAPRNLASGGTYHGDALSQEEWESIWKGPVPWEDICGKDIYVSGTAEYSAEGEPIYISVSGFNNKQEAYQLFHVTFLSLGLSGKWTDEFSSLLDKANDQVENVDIYAFGSQGYVVGVDPETDEKTTTLHWSRSSVFPLPDDSMAVEVTALGSAYAIPTQQDCQDLVERITNSILTEGVSFSQLSE